MAKQTIAELIASLPKQEQFVISKFEKSNFAERLTFTNYDDFAVAVKELNAQGYRITEDLSATNKVNANK